MESDKYLDCTAISDLHGSYPDNLPGGDLLIIAGDMTTNDSEIQWQLFFGWLEAQNYRKKVFIAGNHDGLLQNFAESNYEGGDILLEFSLKENITYLCDSWIEFEGLKIWGSPRSLFFDGINPHCCAFTCNEILIAEYFKEIPNDVDILITHTPPKKVLDYVDRSCSSARMIEYCGSTSLLDELEDRIKPKVHIFGHIHEHGGKQMVFKREGYGTENNTLCINASHLNGDYEERKPGYVQFKIKSKV